MARGCWLACLGSRREAQADRRHRHLAGKRATNDASVTQKKLSLVGQEWSDRTNTEGLWSG